MSPDQLIGIAIVFVVFLYRFGSAPSLQPVRSEGSSGFLADILKGRAFSGESMPSLFQPPRANTTLFKFKLYQTAYALVGLILYLLIKNVPGLADQIQQIVNLVPGSDLSIPGGAGPVVLAFIVAWLLPKVPPFKAADTCIRCMLYEYASIPAQQLRERNRLKKAEYVADQEALENVRRVLVADGFEPDDLVYNAETLTTQSLWTKASLLLEYIDQWQGQDKYSTAFALLKERDSTQLSIEVVKKNYEGFQGNAKACFEAMRKFPEAPETAVQEETFRRDCKELLEGIYDLLSRVSLHSHYSDRERVRAMNQIGFRLGVDEAGPIPNHNDLVWLAMILAAVFVLPLALYIGPGKAVMIGAIMFTTVLTPILLANNFPNLAAKPDSTTPAISLPVISFFMAIFFGFLISITYNAIDLGNLGGAWEHYKSRGYIWAIQYGLMAVLVAWRMHTGSYPETSQMKGIARYRVWGDLQDAAIFMVCTALVMVLVVEPQLLGTHSLAEWKSVRQFVMPSVLSFALGFFVPTWYRANAKRMRTERRTSDHSREEFRRQIAGCDLVQD